MSQEELIHVTWDCDPTPPDAQRRNRRRNERHISVATSQANETSMAQQSSSLINSPVSGPSPSHSPAHILSYEPNIIQLSYHYTAFSSLSDPFTGPVYRDSPSLSSHSEISQFDDRWIRELVSPVIFSDSSDEGDNAITHPLLFDQISDSDESLPDLDLPCLPGSNSQQKSPETNVQTLSNSWESTQSSYNPSPPLDVYGDVQSSQPRNWQGRHQETDNESSDDTILKELLFG